MSPRERTAWIRLGSTVLVFAPYFAFVLLLFSHGDAFAQPLYVAFVVASVLHGLVNGIAQIGAQAIFGRDVSDERDAAIERLSLRVGYYVLISLLLGALATMATLGVLAPSSATGRIPVPGFVATSQFVFCCVVFAELSRHVTQVFCYRRAAWA